MLSHTQGNISRKSKLPAGSASRWCLLPLILAPVIFLTACAGNYAPLPPAAPPVPKITQTGAEGVDYSGLQDFVQTINDQYVDEGLSLFNDNATLNEIDQVALMGNLHQNGWNHNYYGIEEIKGWLETEIDSDAQILPKDYKLYGNYPSMDGALYYQDRIMDIRLIEKPENGKISLLIYNILAAT